MQKPITLVLCLLALLPAWVAYAAGPRVPSTLQFGGITLKLTEAGRKRIQKDVDALTESPLYFNRKVDYVKPYMPIIDRIFKERNVPADFRYLAIQESALIADARSVSNAIGYWQFKIPAGEEVGLRIDRQVDERMNIVSSTYGAATYLKRINFYFKNWVYTLMAYNTGQAGAARYVNDRYIGASKMEINSKTHWYVIKFLAHKIAFEQHLKPEKEPELWFEEFTKGGGLSLSSVAKQQRVDLEVLRTHNKWLKNGKIPTDKAYTIIIPRTGNGRGYSINHNLKEPQSKIKGRKNNGGGGQPPVTSITANAGLPIEINNLPAVIAGKDDTRQKLSEIGGISEADFLNYNDIYSTDAIEADQVYYFKRKKGKARIYNYAIQPGESMWGVSQKFGIRLTALYKKNRMVYGEEPKPGRVLWLRKTRPRKTPVEYREVQVPLPPAVDPLEKKPVDVEQPGPAPYNNPPKEQADTTNQQQPANYNGKPKEKKNDVQPGGPAPYQIPPKERKDDAEPGPEPGNQPQQPQQPQQQGGLLKKQSPQPWPESKPGSNARPPVQHTVAAGETLYGIARKYEVTVAQLQQVNNLTNASALSIGQQLTIPAILPQPQNEPEAPANPQQARKTYTVKSGDTLYGIARKYDITVQNLLQWNGKQGQALSIGEQLFVEAPRPE